MTNESWVAAGLPVGCVDGIPLGVANAVGIKLDGVLGDALSMSGA